MLCTITWFLLLCIILYYIGDCVDDCIQHKALGVNGNGTKPSILSDATAGLYVTDQVPPTHTHAAGGAAGPGLPTTIGTSAMDWCGSEDGSNTQQGSIGDTTYIGEEVKELQVLTCPQVIRSWALAKRLFDHLEQDAHRHCKVQKA